MSGAVENRYQDAYNRRMALPALCDGKRTIKEMAVMFDRDPTCISQDIAWLESRGYAFDKTRTVTGQYKCGRTKLIRFLSKADGPQHESGRYAATKGRTSVTADSLARAEDFLKKYRAGRKGKASKAGNRSGVTPSQERAYAAAWAASLGKKVAA